MAIVTNHNANLSQDSFEDGESNITGTEIELLVEVGAHWQMMFSVITKDVAAVIDECSGVIKFA